MISALPGVATVPALTSQRKSSAAVGESWPRDSRKMGHPTPDMDVKSGLADKSLALPIPVYYIGAMVQLLSPEEAELLISSGKVDVVDVRDAPEWDRGHVPRARLVSFHQLKSRPRQALTQDGVLFVCARGIRSLNAAKLAEEAGFHELYNLDGGTSNWVSAGLPLERG